MPGCMEASVPLIDRIRAVLEREPDAPLSRVCVCVGDSRPEMVATLMRMVALSGRARLAASAQLTDTRFTREDNARQINASLPASDGVGGGA